MSEFLNQATAIGELTGGTSPAPDELVAAESIQSYVRDDENTRYVIAGSDDGLRRETDNWETEEVPSPGAGVIALVTDRRFVFIVGECRDPEVDGDYVRTVEHAAVAEVTVTDSLLSTAFTVRTDEGVTLGLTPQETDGLNEVREFVDRASRQWESAREVFDGFENDLIALEDHVADGDDARARNLQNSLLGSISKLGQTSSLYEVDLPALDEDKAAAKERVANAFCRGYWYRARELVDDGDDYRKDGAVSAAAERYRDACGAYNQLVSKGGPTEDAYDEHALDAELGPFDLIDALTDRLEACCEAVANEPASIGVPTLTALETAIEQLEGAVQRTDENLDADALGDRFASCRQFLADTCEQCVRTHEERGDEAYEENDDDSSREHYEDALDALAVLAGLVDASDAVSASEPVADERERLRDKIERSRWEWVGDEQSNGA